MPPRLLIVHQRNPKRMILCHIADNSACLVISWHSLWPHVPITSSFLVRFLTLFSNLIYPWPPILVSSPSFHDVNLKLLICACSHLWSTLNLVIWSLIPVSHTTLPTSVCTFNHPKFFPVHHCHVGVWGSSFSWGHLVLSRKGENFIWELLVVYTRRLEVQATTTLKKGRGCANS